MAWEGDSGRWYTAVESWYSSEINIRRERPHDPYKDRPKPVRYYVLAADGRRPVVEPDAVKWTRWMAHSPQRVLRQDTLPDGSVLSTVFTGLEVGGFWVTALFGADGVPDSYYQTYDDAKRGHEAIWAMARASRGIRMRETEL